MSGFGLTHVHPHGRNPSIASHLDSANVAVFGICLVKSNAMSTDYLTLAQARAELGVSAFIFNNRFRPELTEIRRGPRTVLFDRVEVEALRGDSDPMWNKKTVSDALDHAWESHWKHSSRNTYKKLNLKKKVDDEIGSERLDKLDYNRIEEWVQELRDEDRSAATIKSRLSCLSKALKLAARKGWIKTIPEFPEVGRSNAKVRYLLDDPDEEAALIEACGALHYRDCDVMRLVIVFLVDTGCRVSELIKVRWKHVRHGRVIFEKRKGGDDHSVRLTSRAQDAIDALLENEHWLKRTRGCAESDARRRTAQNWLTHDFATVRDHAKLPDVSLHTLRHTCASRLVQAGVSLYEVSKFLGHSSITVTERYAHLAPNTDDRAAEVLEKRGLPDKVRSIR